MQYISFSIYEEEIIKSNLAHCTYRDNCNRYHFVVPVNIRGNIKAVKLDFCGAFIAPFRQQLNILLDNNVMKLEQIRFALYRVIDISASFRLYPFIDIDNLIPLSTPLSGNK